MDNDESLVASLPAIAQLALAYAPRRARARTLALLALDARLATLIRRSSEPMLAQLRLAWWREAVEGDPGRWPSGEQLLLAIRSWDEDREGLIALVNGWEALTAPSPLGEGALTGFAEGRAKAFAALARVSSCHQDAKAAEVLGRIWAFEDLAMRLGRADEHNTALALAVAQPVRLPRVSRPLRPLRVLAGLARRRRKAGGDAGASSPGAVLEALKLGLLGL